MARCPKCNYKLRIIDIDQFCPNCKTNIRFYNFEENFYHEAKLSELSQAGMHCKIKRLKASFIGSKLTIARLIVMLLPLAAFLLPAASYSLVMPFSTTRFDLSILGLIPLFTGGGLGYINSMAGSVVGEPFAALRNVTFIYLVPIVFAVFILITSILCFCSIKNMQKINCVLSIGGLLGSIASAVSIFALAPEKSTELLTATRGFGLYAAMAMFAAVLVVNLLLVKKGIPVEYAQGMEERVRIYRQYKAGEVRLEDLPQPVVETDETRAIDAEIAKQEEELLKGGKSNG